MIRNTKSIILVFVVLVVIVSIYWVNRPNLSEIGANLSQEVIEKDIFILTKDKLKIVNVDIFNNGVVEEATVKKNGIIDSKSQVIYINAYTKKSYSNGIEFKEAIRVLIYLHQRKPPFPIAGVFTTIVPNPLLGFSKTYLAFVSYDQFLEQYNKYKDNYNDEEQLISLISENLIIQEK
jgi:hypothetical protein